MKKNFRKTLSQRGTRVSIHTTILFIFTHLTICLYKNPWLKNTESDTLQFVKVRGPIEQLTKMYDMYLSKKCVPGAIPRAGFKLIDAVLCLKFRFEDCTFCTALPYCAIWQKIFSMHYWLSRKAKLSMVSCTLISNICPSFRFQN